MNRYSILLLGALAMGFVACDEAPEAAPVQSNPQPPMFETSQVTCEKSGVLAQDKVLALETYNTPEEEFVPTMSVLSFKETDAFPAGATLSAVVELGNNASYEKSAEVPVTVTDGIGYASGVAWNEAHVAIFGKGASEKTVYYRVAGYVNYKGGQYRIGDADHYMVEGTVKETCFNYPISVESAYYFYGDVNGWKVSEEALKDYKFLHSDKDVADDAVFAMILDVPEGGTWWKIIPQSALEAGSDETAWGPAENGDENLIGNLVNSKAGAGHITEGGTYRITLDMAANTYSIAKYVYNDFLSNPNDANGWNQGASQWIRCVRGKYLYSGAVIMSGGGKFCAGLSWDDNITYGSCDIAGILSQPGGNIQVGDLSLYWAKLDLALLTYELTPVTSVGAIGDFTDWGSQVNFTPSADFKTWTGQITIPEGKTGWKIRMNDNWDFNYGGDPNEPTFDGGNFNTGVGMFNVTVDFSGNYPKVDVQPL